MFRLAMNPRRWREPRNHRSHRTLLATERSHPPLTNDTRETPGSDEANDRNPPPALGLGDRMERLGFGCLRAYALQPLGACGHQFHAPELCVDHVLLAMPSESRLTVELSGARASV